jgi:Spy/CpxP family protein refolding chaperone
MRNHRILAAALALASAFGIYAWAQNASSEQQAPGPELFIQHRVQHLTRRLDLSDAQQQQLRAALEQQAPRFQPLMQRLAAQKQEMLNATQHGQFDSGKVTALANQEAQTLAALIVARQEVQAQIYTLLAPEQRIKFEQMQQRRVQHMHKWMGHGIGG